MLSDKKKEQKKKENNTTKIVSVKQFLSNIYLPKNPVKQW